MNEFAPRDSMNNEEFEKLMGLVRSLTKDVMGLRRHELLTHAAFSVLKEIAISRLAVDRLLSQEEAEKVFHESVDKKYEAQILRIGDYDPELAKALDMHQHREDEWR